MLPDLERKLLRILYNYFAQHRHMPTMAELTVKTGKRDAEITVALRHMEQERYITWENNSGTQHVVLLKGGNVPRPKGAPKRKQDVPLRKRCRPMVQNIGRIIRRYIKLEN